MRELGLNPQPGSGGLDFRWKEDGEGEHVIAQLKSTEAKSYSVRLQDLKDLEYHARTAHKAPVLVIDFVGQASPYFVIRSDLLTEFTERYRAEMERRLVDTSGDDGE